MSAAPGEQDARAAPAVHVAQAPVPRSWDYLPVTEHVVVWAYRLILGREPENAEVVRDHVEHSGSLASLRERFLASTEFVERYQSVNAVPERNVSVFPPCRIDVTADDATRGELFEHVARAWSRLGESEPYWSVLAQPAYHADQAGQASEAFLESGRENVERLMATLRRNGVAADPAWEVLELGCGLGRSTRWLAEQFRKVIAVDVSDSHLRLARQLNVDAAYHERIEWTRLQTPEAMATLPGFDLFFSMIVLQHDPPPLVAFMLDAIAGKLRPGGYAFFQLPTYQRGYAFDTASYMKLSVDSASIEMHAFPQSEVFRIFGSHGCVPLEVFEDGLSGHRDNHRSNTFLFHRPARKGRRAAGQRRNQTRT